MLLGVCSGLWLMWLVNVLVGDVGFFGWWVLVVWVVDWLVVFSLVIVVLVIVVCFVK